MEKEIMGFCGAFNDDDVTPLPADACDGCGGEGAIPHDDPDFEADTCPKCNGTGKALAKVSITYFKPSGKYYTTDNAVDWPRDATHYNGWAPFENVVRIKDMIAVCFDAPHGFPQMHVPK